MKKVNIVFACACFALLWACSGSNNSPEKNVSKADKPGPERSDKVQQAADESKAPDNFTVKLETTKGDILIDVTREWSPHGADRFYELAKMGYYDDAAFFRVIEGFMAQVGINGDPGLSRQWREKGIPDETVKQSNTRGMVTFAMSSRPDSRKTQFFINFGDNSQLDQMRFAPFGKVRDMSTVDKLYNGYGEGAPGGNGPSQGRIQQEGNAYLKKEFPKLDYITKATVVE